MDDFGVSWMPLVGHLTCDLERGVPRDGADARFRIGGVAVVDADVRLFLLENRQNME